MCEISVEQNKAVVRRIFEQINLQDLERFVKFMDETLAEDYIFHHPSYTGYERGPEGFKKWLADLTRGNTNTNELYNIEDMFGEDEKVVTRYTYRCQQEAGTRETTWHINIMYFKGGKLAEEWDLVAPLTEDAPK